MRILGLDVGELRMGVALSDEAGIFAQPLSSISMRGGLRSALTAIEALCQTHDVAQIVVGLPLTLGGESGGKSSRLAQKFGELISTELHIEVAYWDERFSTTEAERVLVSAGVRRKDRKKSVDKMAAALILQGYLDAQGQKEQETD